MDFGDSDGRKRKPSRQVWPRSGNKTGAGAHEGSGDPFMSESDQVGHGDPFADEVPPAPAFARRRRDRRKSRSDPFEAKDPFSASAHQDPFAEARARNHAQYMAQSNQLGSSFFPSIGAPFNAPSSHLFHTHAENRPWDVQDRDSDNWALPFGGALTVHVRNSTGGLSKPPKYPFGSNVRSSGNPPRGATEGNRLAPRSQFVSSGDPFRSDEQEEQENVRFSDYEEKNPSKDWDRPHGRNKYRGDQVFIRSVPVSLFSKQAISQHFTRLPVTVWETSLRGTKHPDSRRTAVVTFGSEQEARLAIDKGRNYNQMSLDLSLFKPFDVREKENTGKRRSAVEPTAQLVFAFVPEELASEEHIRNLFNSISDYAVTHVSLKERPYRDTVKRTSIITFKNTDAATAAYRNLPLYNDEKLVVSYRQKQTYPDSTAKANGDIRDKGGKPLSSFRKEERQKTGSSSQTPRTEEERLKEIERLRKEIALIEEKKRQLKARNANRFGQEPKQLTSQNETFDESRISFADDRQRDNEMEEQRPGTSMVNIFMKKAPESALTDSQWRKGRKMDIQDAKQLVGICQEMCPLDEFESRIAQRDVSVFELKQSPGSEPDPTRAVKKYRRSAAISEEQKPEEIRPPPVLARTMNHLKEVCDSKHSKFYEIHNFVRDRTRSIRQDFTLQGIRDECCVKIHEESVRFHIMSEHRLCGVSSTLFSSKQNLEQLDKCLISLREMYDLRRQNNLETSSNEPEMQAYYVLTQMSNPQTCVQLWKGFAKDVRRSAHVRFALEVVLSASGQFPNPAKFFACVRIAPYLMACLMHSRFGHMRVIALKSLNFTHGNAASRDEVPVSTITRSLGFEGEDEAILFCENMGIEVLSTVRDDGVQQVIALPSSGFDPDQLSSWTTKRADKIVEVKAEHLKPSEIVSGAASSGFESSFKRLPIRDGLTTTPGEDRKPSNMALQEAPVSKDWIKPLVHKSSTASQGLRTTLPHGLQPPDLGQQLRSNVDVVAEAVPAFTSEAQTERDDEILVRKTLFNPQVVPSTPKPQTPAAPILEGVIPEKKIETAQSSTPTKIFDNNVSSKPALGHPKNDSALPQSLSHVVPPRTKGSIPNRSVETSHPHPLSGNLNESRSPSEEIRLPTDDESGRENSEDYEQNELRKRASKVAEERQKLISIAQKARENRYKEKCERVMLEFEKRGEVIEQCIRLASDALSSLSETGEQNRTKTLGQCSLGLESMKRASIFIRAAERFILEAQNWSWEGQPFPRGPGEALLSFRRTGDALWTTLDQHRLNALDRSPDPREEINDKRNSSRQHSTVWRNQRMHLQGFVKAITDRIPVRALASGKHVPHSGKEIEGVFNAMKETGLVRWQAVLLQGGNKEPRTSSSLGMAWVRSRLKGKAGACNGVINHRNVETLAYPCISILDLKNNLPIPTSASTIVWVVDGSDYDAFLQDLSVIEHNLRHLRAQSERIGTAPPFLIVLCFNCNGPISTTIRQETQSEGNNEWTKSILNQGLARAVRVVLLSRETVIQRSEDQSFSMLMRESVTSKVNTDSRSPGRLSRLDDALAKLGNQAWMKAVDEQISCAHWSESDGIRNIIRHVNDVWQTVACAIEDERQKWPIEFSHHREHLAEMKIEVSERMRLPMPSQTEGSDLREYLRDLCDMAGITTPRISDKKGFQAYTEFCYALSSVMLPVVVSLLGELHNEVIPLPRIEHDPQTATRVFRLDALFASIRGPQSKPLSEQDRSGYERTLGKRRRDHVEDENVAFRTQLTDLSVQPRRMSLEEEYKGPQATPKRRTSLPWTVYGRRKSDELHAALVAETQELGHEIDAAIEILRKRRRLVYHNQRPVVSS